MQEFVKMLNEADEDILLHKYNYRKLVEGRWSPIEQANAVFYWRCLLDFCKSRCTTEAEWSECSYRLLPTMRNFCEITNSYVTTALTGDESEALFELKKFTVLQLFKMVPLFDHDDRAGWNCWRCLCEQVLGNMELKLSTAIVNEIVMKMFKHLWPLPEHADEALSSICDLTSNIIHRALFPNATVIMAANQSMLLDAAGNETMSLDEGCQIIQFQLDDAVLYRCMMIVSAMIKTNRFRKMNALLQGVLDNIVCPYLPHCLLA
ncbi:unnamed protein product [Gongylonema pulchrum]|uniref:BLM10_mid domain-containing protein n=1 Tax=Gongylonema pulchrum TaxID=637853 RepID=A0A183EFH1_9BILA|nr:unnamed protein product [Gongylonema pulchrum]